MLLDILKRNLSQVFLRRALAELPRTGRINPERCRSILFRLILRNRLVELNRLLHSLGNFRMRFLRPRLELRLKRLRLISRSIIRELLYGRLNLMLRSHSRHHSIGWIYLL